MEPSPYLQAIQQVPGKTPGEKYKTLNLIARSSINLECNEKRPRITAPDEKRKFYFDATTQVPEILTPLLELEVAKILREPDVIVEALTSTDVVLFHRALKIKWFFDASCESITNVQYFKTRIFPFISVIRRYSVLKALATEFAFKKPMLAEEFYHAITDMYGEKQARPLLTACGLSFILDKEKTSKIKLSSREIKRFFNSNPELGVEYFRLAMYWDEENTQLLIKQHSDAYMKLISNKSFQISSLSSKRTKSLIHNGVELKNYPALIPKLSLKMLTKRVTREKFEELVLAQLPKPENLKDDFNFHHFYNFLKYYCAETERRGYILQWFEKFYGKSLLEYDEFVTLEILKAASPELRVKYARKKLDSMENKKVDTEWICYLPVSESIPELKARIKITSAATTRCDFLQSLIHTCQINSDKHALLKVLEYLATNHKNERNNVITEVLGTLRRSFDLNTLSLEHWKLIDKFEAKHSNDIIIAAIHYRLIHNLPIEHKLGLYIVQSPPSFNSLIPPSHYKRQFVDLIVKNTLVIYKNNGQSIAEYPCCELASMIWTFNRAKKDDKAEIISLKEYPEVESTVKKYLTAEKPDIYDWSFENLKKKLELGDPDLYYEYFPTDKKDLSTKIDVVQGIKLLKTNPDQVLDQWEKYFEEAQNSDTSFRACKLFFKSSMWHQDLPMKFVAKYLEDAGKKTSYTPYNIEITVASLIESPVIEKAALSSSKNITDCPYWKIIRNLRVYRRLNPTPSVNVFLKHYAVDQRDAAIFLRTTASCMPANTVLFCARKLIENQKISIQKQGIMLMKMCATAEDFHHILKEILAVQTHPSIRTLIYEQVCSGFYTTGHSNLWLLWNECVDSVTPRDRDIIKQLKYSTDFPKKYIAPYVKKLFETYKHLNAIKKPDEEILDNENFLEEYTIDLLDDFSSYSMDDFSEEFHKKMFQIYFDLSLSKTMMQTMITYAERYIMRTKIIESRLEYIINIVMPILKSTWRTPDPNDRLNYPAQSLLQIFDGVFHGYALEDPDAPRLIKNTLKSLTCVLSPFEIPSLYISLTLKSTLCYWYSSEETAHAICEILPSLVETFSMQFFDKIVKCLHSILSANEQFCEDKNVEENFFVHILKDVLKLNDDFGTLFVSIYIRNHYTILKREPEKLEEYVNIVETLLKSENPQVQLNITWHLQRQRHY